MSLLLRFITKFRFFVKYTLYLKGLLEKVLLGGILKERLMINIESQITLTIFTVIYYLLYVGL